MPADNGGLGTRKTPPPAVGGTLIAASVIVLLLGVSWLNRIGSPRDHLAAPTVDGVTLPTDRDGEPIEVPPSQPATPVSFGPAGDILRPHPVRARVVDESGDDVLVPLPANATVDTVTGAIVPTTTATTRPSSTTATTRPSTTSTTAGSTTTAPPATTTTTAAPTTTTTTTTTTSEPPPPPEGSPTP